MIVTLWTSRRALSVSKTELSLSNQNEGEERYGSSVVSRGLVRAAMNVNAFYERIMPARLQRAVAARFEKLPEEEREGGSYDLIRATVNLTTASILISIATSLKLPLSTTYVCFMVSMGSSLADRAWGRESAVYRITGVLTVVSGVVRDGLRRLYDRLSGGIDADVRRQCGRSDRIGAVRLDARAQQPQEEQGGRGRDAATRREPCKGHRRGHRGVHRRGLLHDGAGDPHLRPHADRRFQGEPQRYCAKWCSSRTTCSTARASGNTR